MALADLLVPSFVEVGKIKIGTLGEERTSQKGNTWRPPVKLDHFLITTLYRDAKGMLLPDELLIESLKDHRDKDGKLRAIPVMFGSNDLEQVMQTAYVWYVGKQLAGRSDGREVEFRFDPDTGRPLNEPKTFKWHESYLDKFDPCWYPNDPSKRKPLFKLFTSLNVMIASPSARFGGFYRFRTTSEISARQLYGSLLHLRRLTGGVLRGLVFRLVVRPMIVSPNGQTTTVHVVHVEYVNSDLKQLQSAAREQTAFELANATAVVEAEKQYKMLVAAGHDDEPDEDLVVVEQSVSLPQGPTQEEQEIAALEEIERELNTAADLPAIQKFWSSDRFKKELWPLLDDAQHNSVIDLKDKRKSELTAKKPPQDAQESKPSEPPPDEPPPDVSAPAPTKAGKAIVADIEKLCVERAGSWANFREEHGEKLGITCARVKDLTAEQALKVHAMLKAETAGAA